MGSVSAAFRFYGIKEKQLVSYAQNFFIYNQEAPIYGDHFGTKLFVLPHPEDSEEPIAG